MPTCGVHSLVRQPLNHLMNNQKHPRVPTHNKPQSITPSAVLYTHLCAIDEDDTIGMKGHPGEETEELLKSVPVSVG